MDMTTTPPPLILNPMQHVREAGNTFCTSYDLSVQFFFFFYFGAHMQLTQKKRSADCLSAYSGIYPPRQIVNVIKH